MGSSIAAAPVEMDSRQVSSDVAIHSCESSVMRVVTLCIYVYSFDKDKD